MASEEKMNGEREEEEDMVAPRVAACTAPLNFWAVC
jgi:hypothetical protein